MNCLDVYELKQIEGGAWSLIKTFALAVGAGLVFAASIVYGFFHPEKC